MFQLPTFYALFLSEFQGCPRKKSGADADLGWEGGGKVRQEQRYTGAWSEEGEGRD